jgi:hypothetical protein
VPTTNLHQPMPYQHGPRRRSPTVARAQHSTHSSTTILTSNTIPFPNLADPPTSLRSSCHHTRSTPRLDKESSGTFDPSSLSCLNPSHRIAAPRIRSLNTFFSPSHFVPTPPSVTQPSRSRRPPHSIGSAASINASADCFRKSKWPGVQRKPRPEDCFHTYKLSISVSKQPPCKHRTLTGIEQ